MTILLTCVNVERRTEEQFECSDVESADQYENSKKNNGPDVDLLCSCMGCAIKTLLCGPRTNRG